MSFVTIAKASVAAALLAHVSDAAIGVTSATQDGALSAAEIQDCWTKIYTSSSAYQGMAPAWRVPTNDTDIEAKIGDLRCVFTRSFCISTVDMLCELTDRGVTRSSDPAAVKHAVEAYESRAGDRALQATQFKGDVDPNNQRFTAAAQGDGYGRFGVGAGNQCTLFTPDGCDTERVSAFTIGYQIAKVAYAIAVVSETSVAIIPATTAFAVVDGIQDAIDFVSGVIGSTRTDITTNNVKNILNNQQLALNAADAVLAKLTQVQQSIQAIGQSVVTQAQQVITAVTGVITTVQNNLVLKVQNVEQRVIGNVLLAFFDKFSIGGVLRPGRILPPAPIAVTRKLFEKTQKMEGVDSDGRTLQRTDANFLYGYGCDGNDNDNNGQVDECNEDRFGPIIDSTTFEEAVRNVWFTDAQKLQTFVQGTVVGIDDCGLVTFDTPVLARNCKASTVQVTAKDRCANTATQTLPVWFDAQAPTVTFDLQVTSEKHDKIVLQKNPLILKKEEDLVNVGVANLAITDNCDATPYVQLTVYSDEKHIKQEREGRPQAVLSRRYNPANGRLTGWKVYILTKRAEKCEDTEKTTSLFLPLADPDKVVCEKADGQVYTVRICARDQAGLATCTEKTVGVSIDNMKPKAVSQGKVFIVAHDGAYFNKNADDFSHAFDPNNFANHA